MDRGAIILDLFDLRHLPGLQEAVKDTCREDGIPPERARVAYASHGELGPRIVVHVHPGRRARRARSFLFLTDHPGFGVSLSGTLSDKLGESAPAPTTGAVAELEARLALAPLADRPPRSEPTATFSFYLPEPLCREAQEWRGSSR